MYYTYVLKSINHKKGYVGITDNLERRLYEHNSGRYIYTKRYLPWELIYKEDYKSRIEARKREKYLKSASGRRFLKKLFNNWIYIPR